MTNGPDLQERVDVAVGALVAELGPVHPSRFASSLSYIAQRASIEVGVRVVVSWSPYGVVGYPLPNGP